MIAHELISANVEPLIPTMDGEQALQLMQMHGVLHLPLVSDGQYLGLISEEDILKHNVDTPLEAYQNNLYAIHVYRNEHLFDVMKKISDADLTCMPVLDDQEMYVGLITRTEIFEYYHKSFAWSEPGSIIVIEIPELQYSLSEIAHIVEAEQAMVLSSMISRPSEFRIILTLKVNKIDVSRILAALRRYDYDVTATYSEEEVVDNSKDRYDAFMRFLDV